MASGSSDQQANGQKREVSYYGPIYIAAYPVTKVTGTTEHATTPTTQTSDKGTVTEPFDINKYKIPQGDKSGDARLWPNGKDKKYRQKAESPKRSPKRFLKQMKHGIGERLHRNNNNNSNHNGDDKLSESQDKISSADGTDKPEKNSPISSCSNHTADLHTPVSYRLPQAKSVNATDYCRPGSTQAGGVFVRAEPIDDTYDTLGNTSFKISSTEDNYLKNKAMSNERYSDLNHKDCDTSTQISELCFTDKDRSCDLSTGHQTDQDNNVGISNTHHTNKDRVFKHREMIAKLKRKFFESPPKGMKALDVKNVAKKNPENFTNKEDIDEFRIDNFHETKNMSNSNKVQNESQWNVKKDKVKKHFATESRASRLRISGKGQCKHRRHSLDGKLSKQDVDPDDDTDWLPQSALQSTNYVAVVAIDFGTSQSGYAYSFVHDPGTIHTMRRHDSGNPGVFNQKIPTTILLTPDGSFHSFGYGAIEFYHDLDPKAAPKWLFFDRFKMMLFHQKTLGMDCMLRSVSGKDVSAMTIFALSLRYFKDLVVEELSDQSDYRISSDVIRWVITVPAIWRASAKQFMRAAAYEAGLVHPTRPDQLLIALEPEAASIYCRKLRLLQVLESSPPSTSSFDQARASTLSLPELIYADSSHISNDLRIGTRYLVVDCGGGTVDITVHEILPLGRLRELHRASGGAHGSTGVDAEFEKLLRKIFGDDIVLHFKRKRPSGWIEVMSMFESRKRVAGPYRTAHTSVSLPFSFIDFFKKCRGCSVDSAVKKYNDPGVTWTSNGMLKLSPSAMRRLFLPTIDGMKQAIGTVLNSPYTRGLSYMFLVGGFAESSMVQHEIRKDFGKILKIIIPPGVGMTIVKGAVYFGLDPDVVSERRSCQTYGVGVLHRYDPQVHPEAKRISKDGIDWCTDIFDVFVRVDQSVALGDKIIRRYTPVRRNQTATTIHIYSTERTDVLFISDDDVTRCGTLNLSLDDTGMADGSRREIRAEMTFGDTEIKVRATDVTSGRCVEADIDFINL